MYTFKTNNNTAKTESTEKLEKAEKQKSRKLKLYLLNEELYKNRLDQKLKKFNYGTLQEIYEHIKECVNQAALETLGKEKNTGKYKKDLTEKQN